jgi:hypothetical protein
MLVEDLVRDGELADVVQESRPGEDAKLGGRHRELPSDPDAELRHATVVAQSLAILDQVAEDDYGVEPSLDLRYRV